MGHFHVSICPAPSFQRAGHAVAELEVGVGNVRTERELEVGVDDERVAESTYHVERSIVRRRRHSASRWNTASSSHLKQHTSQLNTWCPIPQKTELVWRPTLYKQSSANGAWQFNSTQLQSRFIIMWVNCPLWVSQQGQLSLSSFRGR